jgi:hypothetical protein
MSTQLIDGLFVAEGSSDMPIADIVERIFFEHGLDLRLRKPDFGRLGKVPKDLKSRLHAGEILTAGAFDLIVVHRDADNAGTQPRRDEITNAAGTLRSRRQVVPVVPVRMTEAWLLLDEKEIRFVAGNPRGRMALKLPKRHEVESHADPKKLLQEVLLEAADVKGRRRERERTRFSEHRRSLLERLDCHGPVTALPSWQRMVEDIEAACVQLKTLN